MSGERSTMAVPEKIDLALVEPAESAPLAAAPAAVPGRVDAVVDPLDENEGLVRATGPRPARWRAVWWLLAASIVGFTGYGLVQSLVAIWQRDPVGGTLLGGLALAFLVALAVASLGELRALRRLRHATRLRAAIEQALRRDSPGELASAMAPVLALVGARRPELVRDLRHRIDGQSDVRATVNQFRAALLVPLDREARRVVRQEALAMVGATAVSPHPALDVAIVAWRSVGLVRRIAEIYGLRPSGLAAIRLSRMAVVSAAMAMAADPAGEMLAESLGGGVADKLAGKLAEGSVSGFRTLRLGLRAIELCRPLPFEADERRGLLRTLLNP